MTFLRATLLCFRLAAPGFRLAAPGFRLAAPGFRLAAPGFRLAAAGFCLAALGARAQTVQPPALPPADSWVLRQQGVLRVLNKLDSTVQTLILHVGETRKLQSLSITLQACAVRPEGLPPDATAHLVVTDSHPDQPGYDGWILQKEPAINMLEHPVYDIQLAGC